MQNFIDTTIVPLNLTIDSFNGALFWRTLWQIGRGLFKASLILSKPLNFTSWMYQCNKRIKKKHILVWLTIIISQWSLSYIARCNSFCILSTKAQVIKVWFFGNFSYVSHPQKKKKISRDHIISAPINQAILTTIFTLFWGIFEQGLWN